MEATSRRWDATTYHRASDVQEAWAEKLLALLPLRGDETVLDAGCGSGRVTRRLLDLVPRGSVIAVDSSEEMVEHARETLGDRATVLRADLTELELAEPVDAAFSNAVFHWILDQDRLFERLHAALRPGGVLVAGCGGPGNVERFFEIVDAVVAEQPYHRHLAGFERSWRFPGADETEARLRASGFADVRTWIEPADVTPQDPEGFVRTAPLRCHLERLPEELHDRFVAEVLRRAGDPLRIDHVRLNMQARRPGG